MLAVAENSIDTVNSQTAASTEAAFALEAAHARLLTEVGFLAVARGDIARADAIFGALRLWRPGQGYPWLGLAVARLNAGKADEAVRILEQADCGDVEDVALLQAWRGFALQLAGRRAQSRLVLEKVAEGEGPGPRLARSLLGLPVDTETLEDELQNDFIRS
jgi:hypothetical protein